MIHPSRYIAIGSPDEYIDSINTRLCNSYINMDQYILEPSQEAGIEYVSGNEQAVTSINNTDQFLESFLESKNQLRKIPIEQLEQALKERLSIENKVIIDIDNRILEFESELLNLSTLNCYTNPELNKRKTFLEKEVLALEKEKRNELSSEWRDTALLKKILTESITDYLSAKQKQDLISDDSATGYG